MGEVGQRRKRECAYEEMEKHVVNCVGPLCSMHNLQNQVMTCNSYTYIYISARNLFYMMREHLHCIATGIQLIFSKREVGMFA